MPCVPRGAAGLPVTDRLLAAEPATDARPYTWARLAEGDGVHEVALGAPEALLGVTGDTSSWRDLVEAGAGAGERLVLLADRPGTEGDWRPLAVVAFADPMRADIGEAVEVVREAGIQILVVTGDHPGTAATIARAAGIEAGRVVTGEQLAAWDAVRLAAELPGLRVVARAIPEQKMRLVRVARAAGRTVAVTGDGVNDAPALNAGDVAVAMGSGTAVAKGASDLVLGDDSFATLTYALREGRRIVANVQKGLVFLVSTHVALLGFILIATLAGYDRPLLPLQILWLELFIDLSTSIAFEREPEEPGAMLRPPRPLHPSPPWRPPSTPRRSPRSTGSWWRSWLSRRRWWRSSCGPPPRVSGWARCSPRSYPPPDGRDAIPVLAACSPVIAAPTMPAEFSRLAVTIGARETRWGP